MTWYYGVIIIGRSRLLISNYGLARERREDAIIINLLECVEDGFM